MPDFYQPGNVPVIPPSVRYRSLELGITGHPPLRGRDGEQKGGGGLTSPPHQTGFFRIIRGVVLELEGILELRVHLCPGLPPPWRGGVGLFMDSEESDERV